VLKRLGLYLCATYQNGSELEILLEYEELILLEEAILPENPTALQRRMWELWVAAVVIGEETLRQNMRSLDVVVMSLCDPTMEYKVMTHEINPEIKPNRDTIKLLQVIKQHMYLNGS